ncbi:MAG: hypothetical protein AB1401_06955 [Thermodesulfobacteriota bacterium]
MREITWNETIELGSPYPYTLITTFSIHYRKLVSLDFRGNANFEL